MDYKSSTSLGDGPEKGISSSSGIDSANHAEEQAAIQRAKENLGKSAEDESATFFADGFQKKFGVSFRTEPPDVAFFDYSPSGVVTIRFKKQAAEGVSIPAATEPKTFFTTAADAAGVNKVSVSAGSMGPIMVPVTVLTVADGNVPALKVTFNTSGVITAAVPVANTAANTATIAYFPLATVSVVSGSTVATPTAWNYSWAQTCGRDGSGNIIADPY